MENENVKEVAGTNEKCESCGANLTFDPKTQSLGCIQCGNHYEFVKTTGNFKHDFAGDFSNDEYNKWVSEVKIVKCDTCGAEVTVEGLNISQNCPYCGSTYVLEAKSISGLKPDCVVPFGFDKESCSQLFVKAAKKRFMAPRAFKKNVPSSDIQGIYIPTFTYDADTHSSYHGTVSIRKTKRDSKGRTVTYTETKHISGVVDKNYEDLVVEASSKITDKQLTPILPYDCNKAFTYDTNFIRGYNAEHYIDDVKTCYTVAKDRMDKDIRYVISRRHSEGTITSLSVSTDYSNKKYSYRILPVYNLDFKYGKKEKKYSVFMNGQTGKLGKGLPVSKLKVGILAALGIAVVVGFFVLAFLNSK